MAVKTNNTARQFVDLEDEIAKLRIEYVLSDNGWLEAAYKNDPALEKYGSPSDIKKSIQAAVDAYGGIDKLADEMQKNQDLAVSEVLVYPGLTVMAAHAKANKLYLEATENKDSVFGLEKYALARRYSETAKGLNGAGADIHPGADIASNFFIDHNTGVVIGETARVGKDCFLLHGVTLGGGTIKKIDEDRPGIVRRHPKLGDGVSIGSNANIYGACDIGDKANIKVGATIIDSDIGNNSEICAGTRITSSSIAENVKIYPDAQIFNCVIGKGAKIGPGVRLDGVVVPAYAEIYDIQQPKLVINTRNNSYEGTLIKAKGTELPPKEAFADNAAKAVRVPDYVTLEQLQQLPAWQEAMKVQQSIHRPSPALH